MLKNSRNAITGIGLIIAVVIGLIILVVMMAIFGKETGKSANILESCEGRGGTCFDPDDPDAKDFCNYGKIMPLVKCTGAQKCCVLPP